MSKERDRVTVVGTDTGGGVVIVGGSGRTLHRGSRLYGF